MYYFVLTKEFLFFLKSIEEPTILAVMKTEWVRTDYIYKKNPKGKIFSTALRLLEICDLLISGLITKVISLHGEIIYAKSFLQCDFH
jgi:hypothetical protein